MSEEQNRFSLRKLSVGLASVLIGVSIFGTSQTVKADTVENNQTSSVTNNAQSSDTQENENVAKSTFTNDNQTNNAKNNLIQTQVEGKKDQKQDSVPKTQEATDGNNLDAEKDIVRTSSLQKSDNQSNHHVEDNSQAQPQNEQKLDLTKNSPKFAKKVLATNLTETNNKTTHSYTKEGSDTSTIKTPPKSLLASDNFDYSGTTTVKWSDKMTEGVADNIPAYMVNRSDKSFVSAYSQTNVDGIIAVATTTFDGNNYIVDPNTGKQTRIAKMNRVFYDLKDVNHIHDLPLQVNIFTDPSKVFSNIYISGGADQLSEYVEYLDNQGNKINIPLAYDIQIITSLDGDTNQNERVSGTNGSIVYPYNSNTNFLNNDPSTNTVIGYDATSDGGIALAIGGLNNGLTFSTTTTWGNDQWTMGLATSDQLKNLPYSEIDTRGISRNIHFVDEDGNQIQPTLTQTASWVSVKDKQGNIQTIGSQPNIAEYDIPHELTANGKTYLIDAFTDGNSSKLASWTPANTDKNQDVYLVYKDLDVSVKYVDAISGQTVKNDNFVSDPSQSVTYNYSVPDGYVLEAPAKTSTSYTFGDDKSDTPTITINLRKAIKRHYRVIENLPDGTQKVIVEYNLTLPQRKDGTYGIPDFLEDGRSTNGSDQDYTAVYIVMNKYFGGIPVMSSSNNVRINPDISKPTVDYSNILFDIDQVKNTAPAFTKKRGATIHFTYYKNTPQFTWTVGNNGITTDQNPSQDFVINYQHNTQKVTDPSQLQTTGKRTITISMPKGHGDQMTIVQTVGYKRTGTLDLYTGKTTYTDWVFDADTSNVTVNGQPSTQYQAYVLKNGVVSYAPIKLPHINGYKTKLIQDKANPAMFMVSFMAVPTENKPSTPVEIAPSKPSANPDNTNKPADDLQQRVITELNSNDSGWTMSTDVSNSTYTVEVPADDAIIDLSDLVIAEPVHAQTTTQIRVTKHFKLRKHGKKHVAKHLKHRKKAVKSFKKYRL